MAQTLGSVAAGTVVKLNENNSPVNYIVVHQGLPVLCMTPVVAGRG